MSFFNDVLDLIGLGGPDNQSSAVASTDVQVNPDITAVNVIDTQPLANALIAGSVLSAEVDAQAANNRAVNQNEVIWERVKMMMGFVAVGLFIWKRVKK